MSIVRIKPKEQNYSTKTNRNNLKSAIIDRFKVDLRPTITFNKDGSVNENCYAVKKEQI